MTDVIDATATEIHDEAQHPASPTGTALAASAHDGAIIRAEQPDDVIAKASQIATSLGKLIEAQGLAKDLGGGRKHVEVGGWQALGAMLGALGGTPLHAETVWTRKVNGPDGLPLRTTYTATVKRYYKKDRGGGLREETTYDVDGFDWEAAVEIRTPSGQIVGSAEAMCSRGEKTWAQRDDYALRSMAETRAESRAYRRAAGWIVHLAGYSPTPAEEMGHTPGAEPTQHSGPPHGPAATADETTAASTALVVLLGGDVERARAAWPKVKAAAGGYMPHAVAAALVIAASALTEPPTDDPDPTVDPDATA